LTCPAKNSPRVDGRVEIQRLVVEAVTVQGPWAEFGVMEGKSARHLLEFLPPSGVLHLFDSWKGLPEAWKRRPNSEVPKGAFACSQPDLEDARCVYWPGWFDDTLPGFASGHDEQIALAHLDCDLYSSTASVFRSIGHLLGPGTVLLFDDLFFYPLWRDHQWKAWAEWVGDRGHEWIGHTKGQGAVLLT